MTVHHLSDHRSSDRPWVVVPTYCEAENLPPLVVAVLDALPAAHVLVVDDNSPDGTGRIADDLAAQWPQVHVLHRPEKRGLGPAYQEGLQHPLDAGARTVLQMDCDFSHDPAVLPALLAALEDGADLVLGSRYVPGGASDSWGMARRLVSRGGNAAARLSLGMPYRDVTGGFKAWRAETLRAIDLQTVTARGFGFQVETTWRAYRAGAAVAEVPILFRDRVAGRSKMTAEIMMEAVTMLVRLRMERFESEEHLLHDPQQPTPSRA